MPQLQFVTQPMAPLRANPSDAAEMVNMALFGETAELLQRDRQWLHVRMQHDSYMGWIDEKAVLPIQDSWMQEHGAWGFLQADSHTLQASRKGTTQPLRLSLGARLPLVPNSDLHIGDWHLQLAHPPVDKPSGGAAQALALSERYLGSPYLWGGRALWGIDCSGFTQQAFAMAGIALPRDAREQAACGTEIPFGLHAPGDLAFFNNPAGKVVHVGIILSLGTIRHAAGHVHDAILDQHGIRSPFTGLHTHSLCSIKRIT